jgi:hypothetical protein
VATSFGDAFKDATSVAAPSMAELEPSPNSETHDAASPNKVTRPRDQESMRIRVTLSK